MTASARLWQFDSKLTFNKVHIAIYMNTRLVYFIYPIKYWQYQFIYSWKYGILTSKVTHFLLLLKKIILIEGKLWEYMNMH